MMNGRDVSILLQGPVTKYTASVVKSALKWFPDSKIILSTWHGSAVKEFMLFDRVVIVLSNDPGATSDHRYHLKLDNLNRQIVSTRNGLARVETEFVIKTRTDIEFVSDRILNYYRRWRGEAQWFNEKILMANYNFKHPDSGLLFHPSDLILFGKTTDLIRYFSCSLRSEVHSRWLERNDPPLNYFPYYHNLLTLHTAESYLLSQYLRSCKSFSGNVSFLETCFSKDDRAKNFWVDAIARNFVVVDPIRLGVRFRKYPLREFKSFQSITHIQWKNLLNQREGKLSIDLELALIKIVSSLYKLLGKPVKPDY